MILVSRYLRLLPLLNVLLFVPLFNLPKVHILHTLVSLSAGWMNLEYRIMHRRPSQFSIWFIHGLSVPLRAQLKTQELILMRFQVHHRATLLEPELPPETEVAELGQLLDVFAPEISPVEQMVTSSVTTAGITTDLVPVGHDTSETLYEHYVAILGALLVNPARARLNRRFLVAITHGRVVVILQTYAAFAMLRIRGLSAGT
jgi:hypothetical protein